MCRAGLLFIIMYIQQFVCHAFMLNGCWQDRDGLITEIN